MMTLILLGLAAWSVLCLSVVLGLLSLSDLLREFDERQERAWKDSGESSQGSGRKRR